MPDQPRIVTLGFHRSKSGKDYDLLYFSDVKKGQAIGPLPLHHGAAGVAVEIEAENGREAYQQLMEALK